MGAFFLVQGPERDALTARLSAGFRQQGFNSARSIEREGWRAVCYPSLVAQAATFSAGPGGDAAFCAGTLCYRGTANAEALASLLADHKNGDVREAELFGSFAAILVTGSTASVLTDRTGTFHLYSAIHGSVLSTSFLALAEAVPERSIDARSVYDYVFNGAPLGGATVLGELRLFPDDAIVAFDNSARRALQRPAIRPEQRNYSNLDEAAEHCLALLRERFRTVAGCWHEVDTALTGGFDSRLVLGLVRDAGLQARIHVYGRPSDPDVVCAKALAAGENLLLEHEDKSMVPLPGPGQFAEIVENNCLAFDGYPPDGIFDNGTDLATRRKRVGGAALMLNGGGGEIFRNFFYLADRPYSALDVAWSFYCQFDPRTCAPGFNQEEYLRTVAERIAERVGAQEQRLSRQEVEAVYPLFRCAYWMGRNNSINNRLGYATTPFIDAAVVSAALAVPLRFKNLGRLEARMINIVDPALARHGSVYGRSFDQEPGFKERSVAWAGRVRPTLLRRYSYRLHRRPASVWTGVLAHDLLEQVIDLRFPVMRNYFTMDQIADPAQANRICTLEYLFRRLGLAA
jgi:asparagine synthase (glutamine-hydrolysing)